MSRGRLGFRARFPRQYDSEQIHRQLDVFQIRRTEFFKSRLERIANLPLHVRGNADPACAGQLFNARSDVHAIAINIAIAVNHVADVNADFEFNPPIRRDVMVALGQSALDFNCALRRFQRAAEFHQESVTDGFDLGTVEPGKDLAQEPSMFFEQFESESIVALGQGAVAHHVSEHDGSEFPLLCVLGRHERTKAEPARNETANSPNGLAAFANPAWVGQGGAVRRSATDTMWKTIHNHPEFHQLLAGPKQIGFSQAGRNEFATFFRRAEAA